MNAIYHSVNIYVVMILLGGDGDALTIAGYRGWGLSTQCSQCAQCSWHAQCGWHTHMGL